MTYPPKPYNRRGKLRWQFFAAFILPVSVLWFVGMFVANYLGGGPGFAAFLLLTLCAAAADGGNA